MPVTFLFGKDGLIWKKKKFTFPYFHYNMPSLFNLLKKLR